MNYMRIFSKTSLISTSTVKSLTASEEVTKLNTEIDSLKQTVESLKLIIETRDAAIGTLAREKEKIFVELKTVQRTNRNIHQQLEDERDMHSKEKEFWIEEIRRFSKKNDRSDSDNKIYNDVSPECNIMKEEIRAKDEIIYNLCTKYLKVKSSKMLVLNELRKLQTKSQKACEDVLTLLQNNKICLDELLSKIIEICNIPPNSKQFLKILRTNANLHYENTQLKVRLSSPMANQYIKNGYLHERKKNLWKIPVSKHNGRTKRDSKDYIPLHTEERNKCIEECINFNEINSYFPYADTIYKSHSDSHLFSVLK